jgi:hypothetical protein
MAYRKMKMQTLLLMVSLAMSVVLFGSAAPAKAATGTVVYVDPAEVKDLFSPTTFTISVKVANVTNLYGIDLQMTWDPTIIKYVSHTKKIPVESNPGGVMHSPTIPVMNNVDETASMPGSEPGTRYWLAEASMLPAAGFDGAGTFVEITFQVVGLGTSLIKINAATLADKDGNPIDYTAIDGKFVNYVPPPPPPADIFVNPSSVINANLTPPSDFTVSIDVKKMLNLYSYEFWLGFNASLLQFSQATGVAPFTAPSVSQSTGQIKVSASLSSPTLPVSGNFSLVSIKLNVLDIGETALDLHDVTLLNDKAEAINFTVPGDGYFNNMAIFNIAALIDVKPDVLNVRSKSKWIAAYIELPSSYDVNEIDASTVKLNDTVVADLAGPMGVGDYDGDGDADFLVSFNRTQVVTYVNLNHFGVYSKPMAFVVSGRLTGGLPFEGKDSVQVSSLMGDANCDGVVSILDVTIGGLSYNAMDGDSDWAPNSNFAPSYNIIDIFDLVTAAAHYGETTTP